jgi:hypothetical protein
VQYAMYLRGLQLLGNACRRWGLWANAELDRTSACSCDKKRPCLLSGCCCREAEREALAEANKRERKRQRRGGAAFVDWGD